YNAVHWPLHAKQEDILRFKGWYDKGWQRVRAERLERMRAMGLIDKRWDLAEWEGKKWDAFSPEEQAESAGKMEIYAAQVYALDYNVGRLMDYLDQHQLTDNTLIIFLSDNGACAEPGSNLGGGALAAANDPNRSDNPTYGRGWAQVSNTPYRKYKWRTYEGGCAAPFILSYPALTDEHAGELRANRIFTADLLSTFLDAAGGTYPETYNGHTITPTVGHSILPTIEHSDSVLHDYLFSEHYGNCAVWHNHWKAVRDGQGKKDAPWELYDLTSDRTEHHNVAETYPSILADLTRRWDEWARTHKVFPKN
ncbi:MAG: sulfatase-like hydrolase/transferase, partial [Bacteroidaceae bacterium]|nr:sulfatase-like hydrolase/transferase [Bacteroidaceae bacterium]